MKYSLIWSEQLKNRDGAPFPIYDVVIAPDGSYIIFAGGNKIFVHDLNTGTLLHTLKGHKESVLCLAYARDSKMFASGSTDKQVIIWNTKMEALLKFVHNDPIRCLAFNPTAQHILSGTATDFGMWRPEHKTIYKGRVSSQINCCCWNEDGSLFAIGMNSGTISVRFKSGEEKQKIDRSTGAVWALLFYRAADSAENIVSVDWSRNLTFFSGSPYTQLGPLRNLNFDPLFVTFLSIDQNDFLLIGGSNCKVQVYSIDGIYLDTMTTQNSWIWACKIYKNRCGVACENGTVSVLDLTSTTVHSLHKQRYAYRDSMTDVVIQHLQTGEKVRIKCRDLVKKIAVYEKSLAIQLPERVILYELGIDGSSNTHLDMNYKVKEKLSLKIDCSLLVLCSSNLIFCQERRLESVRLGDGKFEREWTFPSMIRYIKTIGGVPKQEALTVALKNGQITTIFLNNIFRFDRLRHPNSGIRFVDLSAKHRRLVVIDDRSKMAVYDVETFACLFQKNNVHSCSFNSQIEDVLCVCTADALTIVYIHNGLKENHLEHTVNPQIIDKSFVIDFSGKDICMLQESKLISTQKIIYSPILYQLIKMKAPVEQCFDIASMGVAKEDWNALARLAIKSHKFDIARKCFYHLEDYRLFPVLDKYENDSSPQYKDMFDADCYAYEGLFSEAAKIYKNKLNKESLAYDMFVDLRMFEQAKDYANSDQSQSDINRLDESIKQFQNDHFSKNTLSESVSATLDNFRQLITSKNYEDAQTLLNQVGVDRIITFLPEIDKGESALLKFFGDILTKNQRYEEAVQVYHKGHDVAGLAQLYAQTGQWSEAIKIMFDYGPVQKLNLLKPTNEFQLSSEQFSQAQTVFYKAGQSEQLEKILCSFVSNSVQENRFDDCSYYSWLLSLFYEQNPEKVHLQRLYSKNSEIYYSYNNIHKYIEEPYTSVFIEILFNCALFLYRFIDGTLPEGISKVNILFALAKLGKSLKHYKLVRLVYKKLQQFVLQARFEELIEIGSIDIKTKPFVDDEELAKFCYRCSASNTFQNSSCEQEDRCFNCLQPFVHSFYSFDILPLVEFEIDPNIHENQESLFNVKETIQGEANNERDARWSSTIHSEQSQRVQLYESEFNDDSAADDHQIRVLNSAEINSNTNLSVLNAGQLAKLDASSVLIVRQRDHKRYYLNTLPEIAIVNCETCNKFFYSDEFEFQRLKNGRCPFCRN